MRRTASEILNDLEIRIARLEDRSYRTASETEADFSSVKRFFRESIYDPRELDLEELAEDEAVLSVGDYYLVPLSVAKRKVLVSSGEVFENLEGEKFVLINNESIPVIGSKYLVRGETLLSSTSREVVSVMRKMNIRVRERDASLVKKIERRGLGDLLVGAGLLDRRASFDYLDRDMDHYAFIPPYEVNSEIRTWLSMGLREDLIEEKLMRKFKVNRARAQRMMSEYHRNKYASRRRFK